MTLCLAAQAWVSQETPPHKMSAQESAVCAPSPSPLPPKPEIKPRPSKPATDSLQIERANNRGNAGKVKKIVNKFNQPEPAPASAQTQTPSAGPGSVGSTSGPNGVDKTSPQRQAPEVKPKPRATRSSQAAPDQAPPLPMKRSRLRKSANVGVYGDTPGATARSGPAACVAVDGGRSGKRTAIVSLCQYLCQPNDNILGQIMNTKLNVVKLQYLKRLQK